MVHHVGIATAVTGFLAWTGFVHAFVPVALGLTTTALGTLLPILRENDMLGGRWGRTSLLRARSENSSPWWGSRSS